MLSASFISLHLLPSAAPMPVSFKFHANFELISSSPSPYDPYDAMTLAMCCFFSFKHWKSHTLATEGIMGLFAQAQ